MFWGGDDDDEIEDTPKQEEEVKKRKEDEDELEVFEDVAADLDLGELPEELKEYARKELSERPDTRASVIQDFRDVIYERGEVVPHRTDDSFLIRFLRARRFNVEKAHRLMINYYKFKENNPEIHNDVNPLKMKFIGDAGVLSVLPYREQTGRRIVIYRVGNWDPNRYSIEEIFKATVVVLELAVLEQRAQILGGICIFDLGGISLQQAWHMTPTNAKKTVDLLVTCFPIRTHAIHILNESWVFDMVFTIFKPLLNERMREKIFFHGNDLESLHSHIDPKFLPKRYGGMRPEYSYTDWVERLVDNKTIVTEMEQLGYEFSTDEIKQILTEGKVEITTTDLPSSDS